MTPPTLITPAQLADDVPAVAQPQSRTTGARPVPAPVRMAVGGTVVDRCEFDEALAIIASRLHSASAAGLAVGSVNLDHLYHFRNHGRTATPVTAGPPEWLLLADGMPIAWRGRLLTGTAWPRVTGADLLPSVLTLAERTGARVGFFGGSPETHRLLADVLRKSHPALRISGMWAPEPHSIALLSHNWAAKIRAAGTDILVVSLGKPAQERWVDQHGSATGARIFLPCGGAIDFLAGKTRRAPGWMQQLGLEWLYRLTSEPRRLASRYLLQGPVALFRAVRAQLICYPVACYTPTSREMSLPAPGRPAAVPESTAPPPQQVEVAALPKYQSRGAPTSRRGQGSPHRWQDRYSHRLRITDSLVVGASVLLAQYIRFGDSPEMSGYPGVVMTLFSLLFAALWLACLAIFRTRSTHVIGTGIEEYRRVGSASFWTFGMIAMVSLAANIALARLYLAAALVLGTIGLLISRNIWRRHICRKRADGKYQTMVLAIGDRRKIAHLVHELDSNPKDGYVVVGACIPGHGPPRGETLTVEGRTIPILGDESHVVAAVNGCGADAVVVTQTEHLGVSAIRSLMWELESMDVDLAVAPGVMDVAAARLTLRPVAGFPLLHVEKPQYHGSQRFQKRTFDFCFALAALIVTSPLLVAAAVAIKLTSKGPVFYRSERVGINGEPFTMLKLRTMVVDAEKHVGRLLPLNEGADGVLFKLRQDPRVTPVGKLLRRFSIDELPQFINVLKQQMSVVGPRPPLQREVDQYDGHVHRRLLVKPGVTGIWQVSGRSELSWDESVRLDLSYVDNWSMAGDLMIIAKTVKAVLSGHGAY